MTKEGFLDVILKNPKLKEFCKKLYKGNDLYNDLYQEFILTICETREEVFKETLNPPMYAISMILSLYEKRGRVKNHIDGRTNPLYTAPLNSYIINGGVPPRQLTYDPHATELMQSAKEILLQDIDNPNKSIRRDALRLYETVFLYKNIWQCSQHTNITHTGLIKSTKKACERIKKRL